MAYVYLVRCCDGTFYAGYAEDLTRRVAAHNAGRGAKYTRARRPVALVDSEELPGKSEALRREAQLKKLSHAEKALLAQKEREGTRLEKEVQNSPVS